MRVLVIEDSPDIPANLYGRRARGQQVQSMLSFAEVHFDPVTFEVTRAAMPLSLTPTDYKLLAALLRVALQVIGRAEPEHEAGVMIRPRAMRYARTSTRCVWWWTKSNSLRGCMRMPRSSRRWSSLL